MIDDYRRQERRRRRDPLRSGVLDITGRKTVEDHLHHLAHHDALTDLPNRTLLTDRLHQAMAQARRDRSLLALLYLDLNKFKPVNDSLGHDIGDLLLKDVAARLLVCVRRESDTVSRLGGGEFVVVLTQLARSGGIASGFTPATTVRRMRPCPACFNWIAVAGRHRAGYAQDSSTIAFSGRIALICGWC